MRFPGLYHLNLLLRRTPETEFERAMLLHRLRSRRSMLAMAAVLLLAGMGVAGAVHRNVNSELECLALTVYFEARGEGHDGQRAVAHVVMNRVADRRFPDGVCEVVKQGGDVNRNCHFSWWCDRRSDRPGHRADWEAAKDIARFVYWGVDDDPTEGALWYHAISVKPIWRLKLHKIGRIGDHIFYSDGPAGAGV